MSGVALTATISRAVNSKRVFTIVRQTKSIQHEFEAMEGSLTRIPTVILREPYTCWQGTRRWTSGGSGSSVFGSVPCSRQACSCLTLSQATRRAARKSRLLIVVEWCYSFWIDPIDVSSQPPWPWFLQRKVWVWRYGVGFCPWPYIETGRVIWHSTRATDGNKDDGIFFMEFSTFVTCFPIATNVGLHVSRMLGRVCELLASAETHNNAAGT